MIENLEREIQRFDIITILSQSGLLKRLQFDSTKIEALVSELVDLQIQRILNEENWIDSSLLEAE